MTVPETLNATLEDISVMFEQSGKWLIGPGSKKHLAQIVKNREETEASGGDAEKVVAGHLEKVDMDS